MTITWRLADLLARRKDGMSQSELSRQSGVSFTTLNAIAQGKTTRVDLKTLDALCRALGVKPGDLFRYVED